MMIPIDEIFVFIKTTEPLASVAKKFNLSKEDLNKITQGMLASGAAGSHKGHFTPISGILFPDTLAYLIRGQRGQISEIDSYYEVNEYFRRGATVFGPEVRLRQQLPKSQGGLRHG